MNLATVSLLAIGGAFALEGAIWAIYPSQMREMYRQIFAMPDGTLHKAGLFSVALGVVMIVAGIKISAL